MLYKIAHVMRNRMPWIWKLTGFLNSLIFLLKYRKKIRSIPSVISNVLWNTKQGKFYTISAMCRKDCWEMEIWFSKQPEESFKYFHPHGFLFRDLQTLAADPSFLAYLVRPKESGTIVGYFFMRSFFWGHCYRGYFVDYQWRHKGINKLMNLCATEIAESLGLKTFGSIAAENVASLKSAEAVNEVKIIKILENGDYYVQYLPKIKSCML